MNTNMPFLVLCSLLITLSATAPFKAHADEVVVRQADGFGNVLYHKGSLRVKFAEPGFQADSGGSETGDALVDSIRAQARYEQWCLLRAECYASMPRTPPAMSDMFPSFVYRAKQMLYEEAGDAQPANKSTD